MNKLRSESGQTLVFVALGISVLLGFAALATDIGVMLRERDRAQIAADSAAIAAAKDLHYGDAAVVNAAKHDAALNGFTDGSDGVTVAVSDPPSAGEVANSLFASKGFVKVTIKKRAPGFFMKVFNRDSMDIAASAVATNMANGETCIYVLNQTASNAMELQGSFDVSAPGCGIIVDSDNGDALNFGGASGQLKAGSIGVVGGDSGQTSDSTPAPVLGVAPASDPLSWEPPPTYDPSSCSTATSLTGTIKPGCYSGDVTIKNATLDPGLYIFEGDVTLSGAVNENYDPSTGAGVTLYMADGSLSTTTNSDINLTAPQNTGCSAKGCTYTYNGPNGYNGLLIFQPFANSNTITFQMGNSTGTVTGIIYAPSAELFMNDSGGDSSGTSITGSIDLHVDLVVNTFYDKTAVIHLTSYAKSAGVGTSPLTKVTLVE